MTNDIESYEDRRDRLFDAEDRAIQKLERMDFRARYWFDLWSAAERRIARLEELLDDQRDEDSLIMASDECYQLSEHVQEHHDLG
jgi:hypothetical protein